MEFLQYSSSVKALDKTGVVPREAEGLVWFEVEDEEREVRTISTKPDGGDLIIAEERLPGIADEVMHLLHAGDVLVIPAGDWRGIIGLAAFELAQYEHWLDIDAEASLHESGRDPLLITPDEREVLDALIKSMVEMGDGDRHGLNILSIGSPTVLAVHPPSQVRVECVGEGIANMLMTRLTPKAPKAG